MASSFPITWLDGYGKLHGAPKPLQLCLPPGCWIESAHVAPDHACVVCAQSCVAMCNVAAYSLQSGLEMWSTPMCEPECLETFVAVAGGVVWIKLTRNKLLALDVRSGVQRAALTVRCAVYAVVDQGGWKDHLLEDSQWHYTLYAPLAAHVVWRVDKSAPGGWFSDSIYTIQGKWFYNCIDDGRPLVGSFRELANGKQIQPVHACLDGMHHAGLKILAAWSLDRMLLVDALVIRDGRRGLLMYMDGDECRELSHPCTAAPRCASLPPNMVAVVHGDKNIALLDILTMKVADTRDAPGIVTAWGWTPLQLARRECDELARAVAAIDELAAPPTGVGLMRAVLVGFAAEDARLTTLRAF